MKPNPLPFIGEKWAGVSEPKARFDNQTIIITGANVGLGFEAAVKFTSLGAAKVILGVRNVSKGTEAARNIESRTGRNGVVEVWKLDLGSFDGIEQFSTRVNKELSRIDVVILNAGLTSKEYIVGDEGWESTLQVNVLGTALLGILLFPKLKASKTSPDNISHLILITSEAHRWVEATDIPDAENVLAAVNAPPSGNFDGLLQNARSKLFAMYIATALAKLARQDNGEIDVIVTSVCPGACRSDLFRNFEGPILVTIALLIYDVLFCKSTEAGARVYVAAAALGVDGHDRWYKTTALTQAGDLVTSDQGKQLQQKVWAEIVEALSTKVPEISRILQ